MLVIAHRGACDETIENSLTAFSRAIDVGAERIELDIQCSADNELFVFHDRTTKRLTRGNIKINAASSKEIRKLRLANGEPIPLLREVLAKIADRIELNIELKDHHRRIVDHLVALLTEGHSCRRIIVSSFHHELIAYLASRAPDLERALLFDRRHALRFSRQLIGRMQRCQTRILHPDAQIVDKRLMQICKQQNWLVYPYISMRRETRVPELWDHLKNLGVDGLCTNFPRRMHAWRQRSSNP